MKYKNIDWQSVSHIATAVAVVLALAVFVWQVKVNKEERKFSLLLKYTGMYEKLVEKTESDWDKIKIAIRNNPSTKHEIPDRCSSLDYLKLRSEQPEQFYAIEDNLLEDEIQSLNILNEICRYVKSDPQNEVFVNAILAREITFYQHRINDILYLKQKEGASRLFSTPRYDALMNHNVESFFGK